MRAITNGYDGEALQDSDTLGSAVVIPSRDEDRVHPEFRGISGNPPGPQGQGRPFTTGVVAAYILLAFALLVFGLWTGFKPTEKGLPAMQARAMSGGFVAASIMLFSGLAPLWQWRKKNDQQLAREALRDEFERNKDDVEGFEANDQGWTYRSKTGVDARSWETFMALWEGDTVMTLASATTVYRLSRRAFSAEDLIEFSGYVARIFQDGVARGLITTQLRPSAWHYSVAEGSSQRWQYRLVGLLLLGTALAAGTALLIWQLLHTEDFEGGRQMLILSSTCIMLTLWLLLSPLKGLRRYRADVKEMPCIEATITSDAIFLKAPRLYRILKFADISKYKEGRHVIFFFYGPDYYEMLSKRGLDSKQLQVFRDLLSNGIQKR